MSRAKYAIDEVTERFIYLTDLDQGCSITNDAEQVVREVVLKYGNKRILYFDTMENQDELCHNNGVFTHFAPGQKRHALT